MESNGGSTFEPSGDQTGNPLAGDRARLDESLQGMAPHTKELMDVLVGGQERSGPWTYKDGKLSLDITDPEESAAIREAVADQDRASW